MPWIVTAYALGLISQIAPNVAQQAFDTPHAYVVGNAPSGWSSVSTAYYKDEHRLEQDIAHISAPVVLLDLEHWAFTPADQQRQPCDTYRRAASILHAHHKRLIAAPAVDLVQVLAPRAHDRYRAYLRLHLAACAARNADALVIQAQMLEASTVSYRNFVAAATRQGVQANPHIDVLAAISTGPDGQMVTVNQLLRAVQATRSTVDGYWLMIASKSPECPSCGNPRPNLAVSLLRKLGF